MESSTTTNYTKYEIKDMNTFINKLKAVARESLREQNTEENIIEDSIEEELANNLGVAMSTIHSWFNNETRPNPFNIYIILKKYHLTPKEIGAKEIAKKTIPEVIGDNIKLLLLEKGMNKAQLARKLGYTKSMITGWCNGEHEPSSENQKKLANYFNVSVSYIRGETDIRNADNELICNNLSIDEEAKHSLEGNKNKSTYGKKDQTSIKNDFGISYEDISNFIIKDEQLKEIFYLESLRVLTYYTSSKFKGNFETFFNEIELDLSREELEKTFGATEFSTPYKVSIETISKAVLQEKISRMFDEYIEQKMREKGIQYYIEYYRIKEHELKSELEKVQNQIKEYIKKEKK